MWTLSLLYHIAGQSVPHVHLHILPRKGGDFKRNDDVYDHLEQQNLPEAFDPAAERLPRTKEEMEEESFRLRLLFPDNVPSFWLYCAWLGFDLSTFVLLSPRYIILSNEFITACCISLKINYTLNNLSHSGIEEYLLRFLEVESSDFFSCSRGETIGL